ncbi:MAG: type II toxin-antitoxin system VapC family toxin [Hormoscilla sp. GM7CHS1pb]|nr:type II toxin-antitoxin system VapC family toxin [Hormoscilla sp. GM7CHS1pb]
MKVVFADTFYWVSFVNPKDVWYNQVRKVVKALQPLRIVTIDEVLVEFLTFYSDYGPQMRRRSVELVRGILNDPEVQVIEQTHESFLSGLNLYENRLDKGYSLTDCISMNTMRQLGITEVLTHDKHFTQEGFVILFRSLDD